MLKPACLLPVLLLLLPQVTFSLEARTPAYDGVQLSGFKYYSSSSDRPIKLQLGQTNIPQALETALCHMCKGEKAVFVVPAQQMHSSSGQANGSEQQQQHGREGRQQEGSVLIPNPPSKAFQVELCVQLHDLVQVSQLAMGSYSQAYMRYFQNARQQH